MKRIIGYTLFWIGIGMLLAVLFPCRILALLLSAALLVVGYNVFCC